MKLRTYTILCVTILTLFIASFSGLSFALTSNCSQSSIDWVQKAYVSYYGRPGDPGGVDYWACRLDGSGGNLNTIIDEFGNSREFTDQYGSLSNEQLIDTLYQQVFNRDPDAAGKAFYVGQLASGAMNLQSITLNVLSGAVNDDLSIIDNKLEFASYFTDHFQLYDLPYINSDVQTIAQQLLSSVDGSTSSLTNAQGDLYSFVTSGNHPSCFDSGGLTIRGVTVNTCLGLAWDERSNHLKMSWEDAVSHCSDIGMRLPTKTELKSLVRCYNGNTNLDDWSPDVTYEENIRDATCDTSTYVDTSRISSMLPDSYWTSEAIGGIGWVVNFEAGNAWWLTADTYPCYAQCVAEGGSETSMDCNGIWGGTAIVDGCGVCDGDGSTCPGKYRYAEHPEGDSASRTEMQDAWSDVTIESLLHIYSSGLIVKSVGSNVFTFKTLDPLGNPMQPILVKTYTSNTDSWASEWSQVECVTNYTGSSTTVTLIDTTRFTDGDWLESPMRLFSGSSYIETLQQCSNVLTNCGNGWSSVSASDLTYPGNCRDWWGHRDENGNWVECNYTGAAGAGVGGEYTSTEICDPNAGIWPCADDTFDCRDSDGGIIVDDSGTSGSCSSSWIGASNETYQVVSICEAACEMKKVGDTYAASQYCNLIADWNATSECSACP